MIRSFKDQRTAELFQKRRHKDFQNIAPAALSKLAQLDAVTRVQDLATPPGNRLELLTGDRSGQYSIRINRQFRLCFTWTGDEAQDVEIVDYH